MGGHFDAVGIPVSDHPSLEAAMRRAVDTGAVDDGELGGRIRWVDSSGARMVLFIDADGMVDCAKPSFGSETWTTVRWGGAIEDECRFCRVAQLEVLEGGEMAYPLPVELEDTHRPTPAAGAEVEVAVVGFAEAVERWPDAEAYDAHDVGDDPRFASRSLIPIGLFGDGPAEARALLTGEVAAATVRTNAATGRPYQWARVQTYAADYEVVAETDGEPWTVGSIIQGTFWMVGRLRTDADAPVSPAASVAPAPPVAPPAKRRRWFGR